MSDRVPFDILTNVRFWAQMTQDMKRTWYVPPALYERIQALVDEHEAHWITVKPSPLLVGENSILVVDDQAVQAELNKPVKPPKLWL